METVEFVGAELAISRAMHVFLCARDAAEKITRGPDNAVAFITKEVRQ